MDTTHGAQEQGESAEIDALVAFLEALEGEGYHDTPPLSFPTVD
ncbi:MAG: hypothetical protein V3U39_12515 [Acidimicrobiia bacterium]